jgi:hypothetical protein
VQFSGEPAGEEFKNEERETGDGEGRRKQTEAEMGKKCRER